MLSAGSRRNLTALPVLPALVLFLACGSGGDPATVIDLSGKQVDPLAGRAVATVLLFTSTDCPIANRYAPEISRLHDTFSGQGVAFWLVYPDPADDPSGIRAHLEAYGYTIEPLRDPGHRLVAVAGVRVTPEAAVFDAEATLVYTGRIDDRYAAFDKARPAATQMDLRNALEAVLSGRPVQPPGAPAVGCFIQDLK